MIQKWRWDQGRLDYFQFDNLKAMAQCLVWLDGIIINQGDNDPIRSALERFTGLPFAPKSYKVWRNYKRVFECSFLATNIDENLYVTDFCKRIASDDDTTMGTDEFLTLFISRFRFPFPAFSDYTKSSDVVYPFCAILKYLVSNFLSGKSTFVSLEDVFRIIVGNNCTGLEPIQYYASLKSIEYVPEDDEQRQVREMLIFISQLSFLKWNKGLLFLDISRKDYEDYNGFQDLITPYYSELKETREEEYLAMTSLHNSITYPFRLQSREIPTDSIFTEGKRTRVTHIKIERSPLLRKLFFEKYPKTVCNMCICDTHQRYPWTDNILEIHHVLPLSSSLLVNIQGTSLSDVVGLCPNCHRSIHSYYKNWLDKNGLDDFRNANEAKEIYAQAKNSIAVL